MKYSLIFSCLFLAGSLIAQSGHPLALFNQSVDDAVVKKDSLSLKKWYGEDFIFTHGTGLVEGKASWLRAVVNPNSRFISRQHDSVTVELHHKNIGIVYGKLTVTRHDRENHVRYALWYVRVFHKKKKQWQMVSHRTVQESHL